eukprot:365756-Chlamydomonas_euryale.AAC.10
MILCLARPWSRVVVTKRRRPSQRHCGTQWCDKPNIHTVAQPLGWALAGLHLVAQPACAPAQGATRVGLAAARPPFACKPAAAEAYMAGLAPHVAYTTRSQPLPPCWLPECLQPTCSSRRLICPP